MLIEAQILKTEIEALKTYLQNQQIMDALLIDGYAEEAKIRKNGGDFEVTSQELEKYIEAYLSIYSLASKYRDSLDANYEAIVYMITEEREIEKNVVLSQRWPNIEEKEKGILLKIKISKKNPFIPLILLGEEYNGKILLPPFQKVILTEKKKQNQKEYEAKLEPDVLKRFSKDTLREYHKKIFQNYKIIMEIMQKMGNEPLMPSEIRIYVNWKRMLKSYIKAQMKEIGESV